MVRLDPQTHRSISAAAQKAGMSLNAWVKQNLTAATRDGDAP